MQRMIRRRWGWLAVPFVAYLVLSLPEGTRLVSGAHEAWWRVVVVTNKTFAFYLLVTAGVTATFGLGERFKSNWLTGLGLAIMALFALLWNIVYRLPAMR